MGQCEIDKWHAKNFRDKYYEHKFKNSQQETLKKLVNGQDIFLFSRQGLENLNLLVPECQIASQVKSSQQGLNLELKRQNSEIYVLLSLRIAKPVSGKAGKINVLMS